MASDLVAKKGKRDQYANIGYGVVTMSAANALTFSQIQFAVGLFQGIAILLHRVLWRPTSTSIRELVAASDALYLALTTSNRLANIVDLSEPAIVAALSLIGKGVATENQELPLISDFTMLPGGGKLIPANPIYVAAFTEGAAAASSIRCQMEFTFVELSAADYLELIQSQYPANIS